MPPETALSDTASTLQPRKKLATKLFRGRRYSISGASHCAQRPRSNTAIRSDMVNASSWSWVT
jgi:hypothetical protein